MQGLELSHLKEISQFKIKCLSKNSQCQETIKYNDYLIHLESCKFWNGMADCLRCNKAFLKEEIEQHLKLCEGELIKCRICMRKIKNDDKNVIKGHEIKCEIEMRIEEELMKKSIYYFLLCIIDI